MSFSAEESIYDQTKNSIIEAIQLIQEHGSETDELLTSVKETTMQLCKSQMEFERRKKAVDNTQRFIMNNDDPDRTLDDSSSIYNTELNKLLAPTSYAQHDFYKEVTNFIGGEPEENVSVRSNLDTSIVCTSETSVPKDPITKGPIKNACKNTICKHIYDLDSIKIYIASRRKGKACCPYVGCANSNIRLHDIVPDNNFPNM